MKRMIACLCLAAVLIGLTACGAQKETTIDIQAVYQNIRDKLPDMIEMDENDRLNWMGLTNEECPEAIVSICGVGLNADEVWLIRAKDQKALEHIQKLAENRLAAKAEETETYVPDQYVIVKDAKTVTKGLYFAMFVSPEAQAMVTAFETAAK